MTMKERLYHGREQTLIKHLMLKRYLAAFAHIIGFWCPRITYVDGFAGPWKSRDQELSDTSFAIALEQLLEARRFHRANGRKLDVGCCFVEQSRKACSRLREYAAEEGRRNEVDVRVWHGRFSENISNIQGYLNSWDRNFSFVFIDPTGWKGFPLEEIRPLLEREYSEVLINFMTEHIRRFVENDAERENMVNLYGSEKPLRRIEGMEGVDRDDAMVEEYCSAIAEAGNYQYVNRAIVLNPEKSRPNFHLIYATRNSKGLAKFKETEKLAMGKMEEKRVELKLGGQMSFLSPKESPENAYYRKLRDRYLERSRARVKALLQKEREVLYDRVWEAALSEPLVWEKDLKGWVKWWRRDGRLSVEGLEPGKKVPTLGKEHYLVLTAAGESGL